MARTVEMTHIGVVGTGVIGRGWAVVFARAGHAVRLYDAKPGAAKAAVDVLRETLSLLEAEGHIRSLDEILGRMVPVSTLGEAVAGALYVQESILEDMDAKAAIFREMDELAGPETILASSCSSLPPSGFLKELPGHARCIVAHPFNPAYLMPLVELVPSTWTSEDTVEWTRDFHQQLGQVPVVVRKEVTGYVGNRLQAAVVNEAMYLVGEGVISPVDLDATLRWGLGLRWALMGPLETMDLNADQGIGEYMSKFGHAYQAMGQHLGVKEPWRQEALEEVTRSRRDKVALDDLPARRHWRDRMLFTLRDLMREKSKESRDD
jgi:3-hydroxyacyl-CoA dehydrogenase